MVHAVKLDKYDFEFRILLHILFSLFERCEYVEDGGDASQAIINGSIQ